MAVSTEEKGISGNKKKKYVILSLKLLGMGFVGFLTLYGLALFARWVIIWGWWKWNLWTISVWKIWTGRKYGLYFNMSSGQLFS